MTTLFSDMATRLAAIREKVTQAVRTADATYIHGVDDLLGAEIAILNSIEEVETSADKDDEPPATVETPSETPTAPVDTAPEAAQ